MEDFGAEGIVAAAAAAVAVVSLVLAVVLAFRLKRLRAAQVAVLGEEERDLVAHAQQLERGFTELRDWVEEAHARVEERMRADEERTDGCIAFHSLVRYDAYGEMSGRQSSSLALLDSRRSGVVISSILHRDQARIYVKQVREGESDLDLSPEEREAIDTALAPPGTG